MINNIKRIIHITKKDKNGDNIRIDDFKQKIIELEKMINEINSNFDDLLTKNKSQINLKVIKHSINQIKEKIKVL